ncbi:MAG: hypothetical protein H6839_09920 [Planctomycetes bacterium]|nr:hypothetical protein [Planctomycetota bacterium]
MKNTFTMLLAALVACVFVAQAPLAQEAKDEAEPAEVKPKQTSQEDRRKECEEIIGSMRDLARVAYAKSGEAPKTLTGEAGKQGCGATAEDLKGDYAKMHDQVYAVTDKRGSAALIVEDVAGKDGFAIMTFEWASGDSKVDWYASLDELKKAHKEVKIEDKTTDAGEGKEAEGEGKDAKEGDGEIDPWAAYRKEGRNWTYEITGGFKMKTTIKNVTDDGCDMETQMYMNGQAMGPANTTALKFETAERGSGEMPPAPKSIEKEIECKAGTFEAISYDDGKTWMMKKYPGIIVKSEAMELVEFNEGDED